jgi:hypothetical protein
LNLLGPKEERKSSYQNIKVVRRSHHGRKNELCLEDNRRELE